MNKIEIVREFLNGNYSGCYIVNDNMVVDENFVVGLVDKNNDVELDCENDELIIDLENSGIKVIISYI